MDADAMARATAPAASREARQRVVRRPAHLAGVGLLTTLMAALYSAFSLILNYNYKSSAYDLVIFDQAVRSYAHFQPGISIIKGVHNGFGPHFSVLGDHWSPLLATLAPLYWIYDNPQTLLVAQAVLFALAIPPLWVFTRRAFGGGTKATAAAYLVSVAYLLSWPIAAAARYDFHVVAFVPLLTAVIFERLQARRLRGALIAVVLLLLVKEDMGLLVAGIGMYLLAARPRMFRRQWLLGAAFIIGGVADTWIAVHVLIPAFGGRANYYWAYTSLGKNLPQAIGYVITHPINTLQLFVTPRVKLVTMLWLFGAFCFLPLLSPISLATIPVLLERMLGTKFPNWWGTSFQYNAFIVMVLVCAAVDGAARLDRWLARQRAPAGRGAAGSPGVTGTVALACAGAMCALALVLAPQSKLGQALSPSFYHRNAQTQAAAAAVAAVPSGVTVEAVDKVGPHLSARDTVLLWDKQGPRWAPWVIANVKKLAFTFSRLAQQKRRVALLERNGYRVVFDERGYVVLHRVGPRGQAGAVAGSAGSPAGAAGSAG